MSPTSIPPVDLRKNRRRLAVNEFLSRLISLNLSRSGVEIPSFDDSVEHDVENDDGLQ